MNPGSVRSLWHNRPFRILLVGLIAASGSPASAQIELKLDKNVRRYLSFEKLHEKTQSAILSAINNYDNGDHQQSINALMNLSTDVGSYKPRRSLRAWSNQWLALNAFALQDSIETVRKYVKFSLNEDVEIWREYAEVKRMPYDLRDLYQEAWDELQENFNKKRKSWRIGVGTISRMDLSYRYGYYEVLIGVGAPIVVDISGKENVFKFKQLLLYTRIQRVRKSIERLSAGYYFEFSLLEEDLSEDNLSKLLFRKAISAGPVLCYAHKSGLEIGGSFEVVRLLFKSDNPKEPESDDLAFSQTIKIDKKLFLSYANFEVYIRKWF